MCQHILDALDKVSLAAPKESLNLLYPSLTKLDGEAGDLRKEVLHARSQGYTQQ